MANIRLIQGNPLLLQQGHRLMKTGLGGKTAGDQGFEVKALQGAGPEPAMNAMLFEQGDRPGLLAAGKKKIEGFIFQHHLHRPVSGSEPEVQPVHGRAAARAYIQTLARQQETLYGLNRLQLSWHGGLSPAPALGWPLSIECGLPLASGFYLYIKTVYIARRRGATASGKLSLFALTVT